MKDKAMVIVIILLLFDISLTFRSTMMGLYSSVWAAEGKFGLLSCYANSLNILSGIILFGTLLLGIMYLKNMKIDKFLNKFLIVLFVIFGISFFIFWIACDTGLLI